MSQLSPEEKKRLVALVKEYLLPGIMAEMQEYSKRLFEFMEKRKTDGISQSDEFGKVVDRLKKTEEDIADLKEGIGKTLLDLAKEEKNGPR